MSKTLAKIEEVTGCVVNAINHLRIRDCKKNGWNNNEIAPEELRKLEAFLVATYEAIGTFALPIVVRPHPTRAGRYQIIDGEHRWRIWRDLGHERIAAYVIECDDVLAMKLTGALNYLRGEPNPEKNAEYYRRLNHDHGVAPAEIAAFLPTSADEVVGFMEAFEFEVVLPNVEDDEGAERVRAGRAQKDDEVELSFVLSREGAAAVEAAVAREAAALGGKNARGRALESLLSRSAPALPAPSKKRKAA